MDDSESIQANVARLSATCAGSKKIAGGLLVVGGLIPPRISVQKDGFSVRTSTTGSADASYGILVRNQSPNADALNVTVLINFVLANDHLLGSTSANISEIPAGSTYALGGNLSFPGAAPIARLETVIQVGGSQRHAGHAPALDNIVIEPGTYDPSWVGDVGRRSDQQRSTLDAAERQLLGGDSRCSQERPRWWQRLDVRAALPPGTHGVQADGWRLQRHPGREGSVGFGVGDAELAAPRRLRTTDSPRPGEQCQADHHGDDAGHGPLPLTAHSGPVQHIGALGDPHGPDQTAHDAGNSSGPHPSALYLQGLTSVFRPSRRQAGRRGATE